MATYTEIYSLRYSGGEVKVKTVVAVAKAAADILNESALTENHANRVTWANMALSDTQGMADKMLWAVLQNGTIQANGNASTDNDVQFVVNSLVGVASFVNSLIGA